MSCSDKLSRWATLGLQGALLSWLIEPIYLSTVVLACQHPLEIQAALAQRGHCIDLPRGFLASEPRVVTTDVVYESSRDAVAARTTGGGAEGKKPPRPCGSALNWSLGHGSEATLADTGLKLGSTDKTPMSKRQSSLCKASFLEAFRGLCGGESKLLPALGVITPALQAALPGTYRELKAGCRPYAEARAAFGAAFPDWVHSPDLEAFGASGTPPGDSH